MLNQKIMKLISRLPSLVRPYLRDNPHLIRSNFIYVHKRQCCNLLTNHSSNNNSIGIDYKQLKQSSRDNLRSLRMVHHCCEAMIGPSVLDCDMAELAKEVQRVLDAGADYIHLDVMDGHFVPTISFGPYVIECLRRHVPDVAFDCHMMTSEPEKWIEGIAKAQGSKPKLVTYTFHLESTESRGITQEVIDKIKANDLRVGLAISPDTPLETLLKYSDQIDLALIMTVYPGKGGQKFMQDMMDKVKALREKYPTLDIEVDGGVKPETVDAAAKAGANLIVSGSGVYKAKDMAASISTMKRSVEKLGQGREDSDLSPMQYDK